MMRHQPVLDWLRDVSAHAQYMTSVCTGSLLLASAGLLRRRKATTHWAGRGPAPPSDSGSAEQASPAATQAVLAALAARGAGWVGEPGAGGERAAGAPDPR
jgi:putative intracellular protease/amidase